MRRTAALIGVAAITVSVVVGLSGCGGSDVAAKEWRHIDFQMGSGASATAIDLQEVYLRGSVTKNGVTLTSTNTVWDPINFFLYGDVKITNNTGGAMYNTTVTIPVITPTSVLSYDPYDYGTIEDGAESDVVPWTFYDFTSVAFTFTARVSYSTTP